MSRINYRPEIDGLRALAILPVVVFHLGAKWLPGGFVGVDVFFVISGYLISSIILSEHANGVFSFKNFWLRRVRRIVPAMLFMLFVSLLAGSLILFGAGWASLGWQSIATLTFSVNVLVWSLSHSYWGPAAQTMTFLHNWSLAVEEQFYLLYPLFAMAILVRWPRKLFQFLVGIFLLSLTLCIFITLGSKSSTWAFYFLPTRAWELAGGCILAALAHEQSRQPPSSPRSSVPSSLVVRSGIALLGVVLIIASWFVVGSANFPGYKALMPVAGAMLFIHFGGGMHCPATLMLSTPLLRYLGRISYSLYLWHWPVIVLGRAAQVRWDSFPAWIWMTLIPIPALIGYYLVELPGRRRPNILPPVVMGAGVVAGISVCLICFKPSYNLSAFAPTVWMGFAYTVAPEPPQLKGALKARFEGVTKPDRDPQYSQAYSHGGIIKRYGGDKVDILVLGNSHALMWAPVIDEICQESRLTVSFYAADGVDPFPAMPARHEAHASFSPDEWFTFDSSRVKLVRDGQPRLVIMASRWRYFTMNDNVKPFLSEVCNHGLKLLFIEDPPELAIGDVDAPQFASTTHSSTIKADDLAELRDSTAALQSLSDQFKCCSTLITADLYLAAGDRVRVRDGNSILYINDDHLSLAGARLAKDRIKTKILSMLDKSHPQ